MADKDDKKVEKTDKADKAPRPEKAERAERAAKAKAEAASRAQKPVVEREPEPKGPARLHKQFDEVIRKELIEKFGYKNPMEVPRLTKVSLNMGLGIATQNPKIIETAAVELAAIVGQKPVVTRAKKSIATFKLREGAPIGVAVTLRRDRMWEFVDRLFTLALPRVRDFRGLPTKSFDGRGNYAMGLKEQIVFPEINYDQIDKVRGMDIIITTTAKTDEEARELLRLFNFPFPAADTETKQAA